VIQFFSFLTFIVFFFALVVKNFKLQLRASSLAKDVIKLNISNFILSEKLTEISNTVPDKADPSAEAFLKFVSDSRDWAYQYIEEVQGSLHKFINSIEPEIAYFDEYGLVGDAYPHYHSMKKISAAYKEIKKLIPEDYDRIE
jgi:hypothetical protein